MFYKQLELHSKKIALFRSPNVSEQIMKKIEAAHKFQQFINKAFAAPEVQYEQILVDGYFMFGKEVGFVNLVNKCLHRGKRVPGYVFLRGSAVVILMLINGRMLLVRQFRAPINRQLVQAPAGMMDQEGDFAGVVAKEIQEQTGITIDLKKLKGLGTIYPSPGACDQQLEMFSYEDTIGEQQLQKLLDKEHGLADHGESIRLELQEFTLQNVVKTQDAKLMALWCAYHAARQAKL